VTELETYTQDERFQFIDDIYLDELSDRIAKLRTLHEKMENRPDPLRWLSALSE
jgi:hypothetical protein